jgi:hypothetical protein
MIGRSNATQSGVQEAEYAYPPIQCCASYYKSLIARTSIEYTHVDSTMGLWMFMSESTVVYGKMARPCVPCAHSPLAAWTERVAFM